MNELFLVSGAIALFCFTLLISKKNKLRCDYILILWFFIVVLQVLIFYLDSYPQFHFLLEIGSALVLLHGPFIWLYSRMIAGEKKITAGMYAYHFIPFIINMAMVMPYVVHGRLAPFSEPLRILLTITKLASILSYCLAALYEVNRQKEEIKQNTSSDTFTHLKWLGFVIYSVLLLWLLGLISQIAFVFDLIDLPGSYEDIAVNTGLSILIIMFGYYGFTYAPVFIKDETPLIDKQRKIPSVKYKNSGLNTENMGQYVKSIESEMVSKKFFKDPELTLGQMAGKINLSSNQLSQIINEHYRMNFYDFVNSYRVNEVIRMIESGNYAHLSLLGIGLDAGFNSKASFNRHFKKITGKTPSQYIRDFNLKS